MKTKYIHSITYEKNGQMFNNMEANENKALKLAASYLKMSKKVTIIKILNT